MKPTLPKILVVAATVCASHLQAATIQYHRFGNNPSDPGSLFTATVGTDLTQGGSDNVTAITLPGTGAGSDFANPILGQTNTRAAVFNETGDRLSAATGQLGLGSTFTIEAMANLSAYDSTKVEMIASQWITASPQRSWFLGVASDGKLRLQVSSDGTASTTFDSGLTFSLSTDYYVAAVFSSGTATFYMQNLTLGTAMQSVVITPGGAPTSAYNSTGNYQIGNYDASNTHANAWGGLIDEVRLSNTALTSAQLMIPEPGSAMMVIGAAAAFLFLRRRSRRRNSSLA